jgi:hypothetical protein
MTRFGVGGRRTRAGGGRAATTAATTPRETPADLRRTPMRRRAPALCSGLVCILTVGVVAACGDSGGRTRRTADSATATAAAGRGSGGGVAADQAKARALLLVPADFSDGWDATPHRDDNPVQRARDDELAACEGRHGSPTRTTATVSSPVFVRGDAWALSQAEFVRTAQDFAADVAFAKTARFMVCSRRALSKALQAQSPRASVQSVTIASLPVARYGAFSTGFRATARTRSHRHTVTVYVDVILLGKGRAELNAVFSSVGQPFDQALERALVAKLGARLASGGEGSIDENRTYRAHGVSFEYPAGWRELTVEDAATGGSDKLWTTTVGIGGDGVGSNGAVTVEAYRLNIPITAENLEAAKPEFTSLVRRLLKQVAGTVQAGPEEVTVAGKPGLRYKATFKVSGGPMDSTLVFALDGRTEYAINCQHTREWAAEIEQGCDQIVRTFKLA